MLKLDYLIQFHIHLIGADRIEITTKQNKKILRKFRLQGTKIRDP